MWDHRNVKKSCHGVSRSKGGLSNSTACAGNQLSACLGGTFGAGGAPVGPPNCSFPQEASWCGFLVSEEVQDQDQAQAHLHGMTQELVGSLLSLLSPMEFVGALLGGGTVTDVLLAPSLY